MGSSVKGGKLLVIGSLIAAGLPLGSHAAHASKALGTAPISRDGGQRHASSHANGLSTRSAHAHGSRHHGRFADAGRHGHRGHHGHDYAAESYAGTASSGGISCVPFARAETGIEVAGNAADWWNNAAGVYARGQRPEVGSVLNFRANGHMHLGHVAVVKELTDSRHLVIDHANWGGPGTRRGAVSRHITVVDVSADNDWSAVRVELGHSGNYGSIYPTYGFIYARTATGTAIASNTDADRSPLPEMRHTARDLRPSVQRVIATSRVIGNFDEVAEAPEHKHGLDLSTPLNLDAPFRSFR